MASDSLDAAAKALPKPPLAQSIDAADPGSNVYAFSAFDTVKWTTAVEKRPVEALVPQNAVGKLPVLVFMGGKKMQSTSYYRGLVEHVAKKGAVLVFVEGDDGAMPFGAADQVKPARAINEGANEALARIPCADATRVYYAGHSLGAKCTVIATALATTLDTAGVLVDPKGILLAAFDNSNGGPFAPKPDNTNPANGYAVQIAASVEVTILEFEDDSIAGPKKLYAVSLYNKLPSVRKQHVLVRGSKIATSPKLAADHNTILTGGSVMAGGSPKLNALDWYCTWRYATAIVLSDVVPSYAPYAYGDLRTDGGPCSDGTIYRHILKASTF
jgi:hypothetical protein